MITSNINPNYPENFPPHTIECLEKKMRPGEMSETGFLANNESLLERCRSDRALVQSLNTTEKNIADRLFQLVEKAWAVISREKKHAPVLLEQKYVVTITTYGGYQECPFGCKAKASNGVNSINEGSYDLKIKNLTTAIEMKMAGFIVHLIREHGFFEGNVPYRADPRELVSLLEIQPHKEYPLITRTVQTVFLANFVLSKGQPEEHVNAIKAIAGKKEQKLTENVKAYYIDDKKQWLSQRDLNRTIAQIFVFNFGQDELPNEAIIFGMNVDRLYFLSGNPSLMILEVSNREVAVIESHDRLSI